MTLENLIRIVAEVVEKVLFTERLKTFSICFDWKNESILKDKMQSINNKGELAFFQDANIPKELPDVLFLDYIPTRYVSKIALGLSDCPFTIFISEMLLSGKTIIVLSEENMHPHRAANAYASLFANYKNILKSYGFVFLDGKENKEQCKNSVTVATNTYSANVLSKADILLYANNSKLEVDSSVIVTELARDEAKRRNIDIVTV